MALAIRQTKTIDTTSALGNSPVSIAFDSSVLAGSLLVVAGGAVANDAYDYCNLSGVTDTRSNTWQSPINEQGSGSASVFVGYAMNVAAGATTLSVALSSATNNRYSIVAYEVTGAMTTSALNLSVVGSSTANATTVSTATSATLAQAENFTVLVGAGAFGDPSNTAGYTEDLSIANGGTKIGTQIMSRITNATTALTGTVTHELTTNRRSAILAVFKQAAAVASYEYEFDFDPAKFTDADTDIVGYVWRNGTPATVLAEVYTGLAGDAVAGKLIFPAPPQARVTDTVSAVFYNADDGSSYVSGIVKEV